MDRHADFEKAQERVNALTKRPGTDELLELYALFKQAMTGDATGSRPGALDFKARAKFDSWAKLAGTTQDDARDRYIALVHKLVAKYT